MNIFLHELKAYRKSTIIWAVALSALVVIFIAMYPAFNKDIISTKRVLQQLPPAFRDALNISLKNFFTVLGFYAYLLNFAVLAGAVQAMNIGTGIISKEDAGKTADFLLSKPVTRSKVMVNKILAALTTLVITNLVFVTVSVIAAKAVSTTSFSLNILLMLALSLFFVQLIFLSLGTFLSVTLKRIKSVISVSLPTVFAFYVVSFIGSILNNQDIRFVTPFRYFDTDFIISHGHYDLKFLIIEAIIIVIAITTSFIIYLKKDIRAAS